MMVPAASPSLPLVLVNGQLTVGGFGEISTRDRGFTLADGLFETMRVHGGVVFRLDRHLSRLSGGLRTLDIPDPPELRSWLAGAVAQAGVAEASIRLTVTRGAGPAGLTPPADAHPTVVIAVNPMPAFPAAVYEQGLKAKIASGRRNPRAMSAGLKTISYTDSILAWMEAQRAGADEAIFLDTDGHCSEATASNLFIVSRGTLRTPSVTCAALPGITRAAVIELAGRAGLPAREEAFAVEDLLAADEVFLTSSLRGIAPVTVVDGRPIGGGTPGQVMRQIASAYLALVQQECSGA
jgi:branched-chain amino acid aminotransferase